MGVGEEKELKNNSDLTHSASTLTGLPARWGFACPIFLSIFSRDLMRAISLLGYEGKPRAMGAWICLTVPWAPDDRMTVMVTAGLSSLEGFRHAAIPGWGK